MKLGIPHTIQEIASAGAGIDLFQGIWPADPVRYLSFDSRTIAHGSQTLFLALKTANRDGHDFIEAAYQKGVRHFITEQPLPYRDVNYVLVDNTLEFVQRWAYQHRIRMEGIPVIALTGSNGKTTVKEWAATLMEEDFSIVKSPMSYNSQLGVAISLLQLRPGADIALIEAGISEQGEMASLAAMIQPEAGVLTHMGDAHQAGFNSEAHKLSEKLLLFQGANWVLTSDNQSSVTTQHPDLPWKLAGAHSSSTVCISEVRETSAGWELTLPDGSLLQTSLQGEANLENLILAAALAAEAGVSWETIARRAALLHPVEMRTEIISDHPRVTIISDSYNADAASVRNAFQLLLRQKNRSRHLIVLTDLPHQGDHQEEIQSQLLQEAIDLVGSDRVFPIGPVFQKIASIRSFRDVSELTSQMSPSDWDDSVVLLKGARSFALEDLIPWLQRKPNATFFRVDLDKLSHNFRELKSLIPGHTKIMAMVKAASYGSGTWEIAQHLSMEGADYLAVAYSSEGIELREAGIELPIMVMNPDPQTLASLVTYDLEPEISSFTLLDGYLRASRLESGRGMRIHLKLETGMARLGFSEEDLAELGEKLLHYPDLEVISVMSHLAAADDLNERAFSLKQIETFTRMADALSAETGIQPFRHILNTAGVLHFPEHTMDMVRFGIGLYGIDPTPERMAKGRLQEIGSLHAFISALHHYPPGTSIGYGRSQITDRETIVATVPIGYADGIFRSLGNGQASFLVRGQLSPTIGRVCMDMLMLDVTDIEGVMAGDEVVLFGEQDGNVLSVEHLATAAGTIPYEVLVRISPRVRRIYDQESS